MFISFIIAEDVVCKVVVSAFDSVDSASTGKSIFSLSSEGY